MTREEYETIKTRPCDRCRGLTKIEHIDSNNADKVICAKCGSRIPWRDAFVSQGVRHLGGTLDLKRNNRKSRTDYPFGEDIDSVWERFDDRCIVCGITTQECGEQHVGRQRQHVAEYAKEGHKGPIVPICTQCHPIASALQRARDNDRALMRGFAQFSRTHGELSDRGLAVSQSGVSPDSVRPASEEAIGLMERLSDDDADH